VLNLEALPLQTRVVYGPTLCPLSYAVARIGFKATSGVYKTDVPLAVVALGPE